MATLCPNCNRPIDSRDINVATDVAYCRRCQIATPLSVIQRAPASPAAEVNLDNPPPGAWVRDDGNEVVIGATTRSWMAAFLIPFTLVWVSITVGGVYGSQIVSGKFNPAMSMFGIPFLLGAAMLVTMCLMSTFGRVEVRLRGSRGDIFTGVGVLGLRRVFDAAAVARVYEEYAGWSMNRQPMRAIFLEGATRVKFGSLLSEPRRYFVREALRKTLGL